MLLQTASFWIDNNIISMTLGITPLKAAKYPLHHFNLLEKHIYYAIFAASILVTVATVPLSFWVFTLVSVEVMLVSSALLLLSRAYFVYQGEKFFNLAKQQTTHEEYFKFIKLSADQGFPYGQFRVAEAYHDGISVEVNLENAIKYYQLVADQQLKEDEQLIAINRIGLIHYRAKRYSEAFALFKKSADQGNDWGQFNTGFMLRHGLGVEKDLNQALIYLKKAADQGHTKAENLIKEINAFETAKIKADEGDEEAQISVAKMYEEELGVLSDPEQVFNYYKLAADQWNPEAALRVAQMYQNANKKDDVQALEYYRRAMNQGCEEAIKYVEQLKDNKNTQVFMDLGRAYERQGKK